jgi:hypothetical protein
MHFRRARRQRHNNRYGHKYDKGRIYGHYDARLPGKNLLSTFSHYGHYDQVCAYLRSTYGGKLGENNAVFHAACARRGKYFPDEAALLDFYFRNQDDTHLADALATYCIDSMRLDLEHITKEYLERVAKLRLFL